MDRFFDFYLLAALAVSMGMAITRALSHRGVEGVRDNRPRSFLELAQDLAGSACHVVRIYETVAYAVPLGFHLGPPLLGTVLIHGLVARSSGAICWAAALAIYALAQRTLGASWRMRVSSKSPGALVTHGIFAWSRHPIYFSFMLMNIGTFLILGRLVFVVISAIAIPLLHWRMVLEEPFLAETYKDSYRDYCSRVGRYCRWF
jgi:protein-S-isoprenylcysteine O-methyltransferase Ste14